MGNSISWDERLTIDGGPIDEDHKKIIGIINNFLSKVGKFESADEIIGILQELHTEAQNHFRHEEELQRKVKFPERDVHFAEHNRLTRTLEKLIEETRPTGGAYVNIMGEKVADFIHDWLFSHILKSDMKMKAFVKPAAREPAPADAGGNDNNNANNEELSADPEVEKMSAAQ